MAEAQTNRLHIVLRETVEIINGLHIVLCQSR